jgi:hypothetical protein
LGPTDPNKTKQKMNTVLTIIAVLAAAVVFVANRKKSATATPQPPSPIVINQTLTADLEALKAQCKEWSDISALDKQLIPSGSYTFKAVVSAYQNVINWIDTNAKPTA